MSDFSFLQQEILRILKEKNSTYSHPLTSFELSRYLNVTASYIRYNLLKLEKLNLVGARHGRGGGFFLK